ncbi:sensor histidine kinase [Methyloprofundus sp.]|uniref:sensor histidine kinase n=1 Tax=Methyloprofundus sp. TaxID=2020875 RepID=UPI003D0BCCC1
MQTVYAQLENEAYFTSRQRAENLVDQIEQRLQQILQIEQNRPIAEYSFFNVLQNPLLSESTGVKFSPLSEIPPKSDIKGLIGFFQINTDGSFHLPALPELEQNDISGLSLAELESRLRLKQTLRDLLSLKIPESIGEIRAQASKSNAQYEQAEMDAESSHYRDEFIQQPSASTMPALQIQNSLDDNLYAEGQDRQRLSKTEKKYKTRKEIVQLPDQAMASSYFKRSKQENELLVVEQENAVISKLDKDKGTILSAKTAINVLSFESEVTPLQLLLIGQDYFCFYRYIWDDQQRYTQGFIIYSAIFLTALTQSLAQTDDFSSLVFLQQEKLLLKMSFSKQEQEQETPIYQRRLTMPLQKMEIIVSANKLPRIPGSLLIDLLAISTLVIFILGFSVFYRLGSKQIDLAKQQQNFISAISHELKTPLTSIRMYAEMLRSEWVTDEHKKRSYYDFIFFESERLSRLIINVLQLTRLTHQKQHSKIITLPALNLFKRIPSKVETQILASAFQLRIFPPSKSLGQINIKVDEDAFFQIIINLVDNALKFAKQSDKKQINMGIELSKNKQQIIFSIRDYGPGIKKDQLKKVFQLFYRAGNELTRTSPGTGIGLALVAQLADTMHARVVVRNTQPGTEFQIKIPVD